MPTQTVEGGTPCQGTHSQPDMRQTYILQDKDDDKPNHRYHTRSRTTSIMQEAMLTCIDITKPKFKISTAKLATRKFPLIVFVLLVSLNPIPDPNVGGVSNEQRVPMLVEVILTLYGIIPIITEGCKPVKVMASKQIICTADHIPPP